MAQLVETHGHTHDHESPQAKAENLKFAMWLYLASEVIIFSILIAAFAIFRVRQPEMVDEAREALSISFVSVNTFVLLASSWAMVMGLLAIQKGNNESMVRWIGLTGVLGLTFVLLQLVEYQELRHEGIALYSETAGRFGQRFYPLTAFHGAHVIVGVIWAFIVMFKGIKRQYSPTNYIGIEIFGLYWHFVDVVWIILFTMIYLI
ncbi:MAG: heme-copper oxidase subunit III [Chloroflexi bacterium]|nr:MAG: heme-copper oxidase subunit III [Chloroflexota bacterium]